MLYWNTFVIICVELLLFINSFCSLYKKKIVHYGDTNWLFHKRNSTEFLASVYCKLHSSTANCSEKYKIIF